MSVQNQLEVPGYLKGDSDEDYQWLCLFSGAAPKAAGLEHLTNICCALHIPTEEMTEAESAHLGQGGSRVSDLESRKSPVPSLTPC